MGDQQRLGGKVRALRRREELTQAKLAKQLGISASYLNLIEHDRRPLSAPLLIKLAELFQLDLSTFATEGDARTLAELMEAFGDPLFDDLDLSTTEIKELVSSAPVAAQAVSQLYQAYLDVRESAQSLAARLSEDLALPGVDRQSLPSEQVSDFIQRHLNFFPDIEEAAEELWRQADLRSDDLIHGMARYLRKQHDITIDVVRASRDSRVVRRYDEAERRLILSETLPPSSRAFQIAHQIGLLMHSPLFDRYAGERELTTPGSKKLCRVSMANYFAGAVYMPYESFLEACQSERYDIEVIGNHFSANFEQVCHRMTTLRRPGSEGVPFHFLRADIAGNVSKRFNGSGIRMSRFGGSCPRWNLHRAFLTPGRIGVQVSRTANGRLFICMARTVSRQPRGYHAPKTVQAISLGCSIDFARELVYADGIDLENTEAAVPIGTTCRLCEQMDCEQRAFPPIQRPFSIDERVRGVSFYAPVDK